MPRRLRVHFKGIYSLTASPSAFAMTGGVAAMGVGNSGGGTDFAVRSSAAGVFRAFGYDTSSQLGYDTAGLPLGYTSTTSFGWDSNTVGTPAIDSTQDASGSGESLKFTLPAGSGASAGGKWETRYSDDDSFVIGANQTLYFQFRYRQDGMMQQSGLGTNPEGVKIAFIDCSGDTAAGSSGTPLTLVLTSAGAATSRFMVYCYPQVSTGGAVAGTTFGLVAPPFTGDIPSGVGADIPINEWVTFTGSLALGSVLTASPYNGLHIDATLTIDMIRADGTKTAACRYGPSWYDAYNAHSYIGLPWKLASAPTTEWRFGKFTLLPYTTGRDGTAVSDWHFWYDELILSVNQIADPATAAPLPAWRQALVTNQVTDIATNIPATPFRAAGYDLDPYKGDAEDFTYNLSAWGAGCHAPDVGNFGSLICAADGHENQSGATMHCFDLETATWVTPIGAPQIHRQVSPSYTAPAAGVEYWYNPDKVGGVTDLTYYQTATASASLTGGTFTLTWNGQTTSAIAWDASAATIQSALEALSNIAPGDVTVSGITVTATGIRFYRFTWTTPSNAQYLTVQPGNLTASDGTAAVYLFELWTGLFAVIQERDVNNAPITRTSPWCADQWSFAYFPLLYGPRASPNYSGGLRYDNLAVMSSAMGGETNGSIYCPPTTFVNQWATITYFTGARTASIFGCTSRDWITPPTNAMPLDGAAGDCGTFVSEKHKLVFSIGTYVNSAFGVYDPATNSHKLAYLAYPYEFINWTQLNTVPQTACVVTEGHPFHLFITAGVSFGDYVPCLLVHDGDECFSRVGVGQIYDPNGVKGYGIYPQTYTNGNGVSRLALLDASLPWTGTDCNPDLIWSAKHRRLIMFNMPSASGDFRSAAPLSTTIRIITIPETNWKTDPWHVEARTLTAQTGIRIGRNAGCWKRVFYSDALDCLILAGGPEQLPSVQALALTF